MVEDAVPVCIYWDRRHILVLCFFLLIMGSSMFRKGELRERGVHITLMIQADIVAYHAPPETPQLGFLQPLVDTACRQHFNPELTVGSATVCCSDHLAQYRGKPFREQGFPAAQVSERTGPSKVRVMAGDLSDRPAYDLNQVRSICKVQVRLFPFRASRSIECDMLLHAASSDLPEGVNIQDLEGLD
ncbi:hypothetical protein F5J12DRAFT_729277 [Pisolithus orientalis]|uniref:uncharacterized protein n=1 Tax=Pisolithus orientalis TaxID=936130 RepID=UPI0022246EE6|nr:uncharacterized protein F5J12DRAFT_729277 [Pisolithus orientalis]KAI5984915.1 hypothetical protein F5J12DRAFT_729277 [Pisolithus orientalis]